MNVKLTLTLLLALFCLSLAFALTGARAQTPPDDPRPVVSDTGVPLAKAANGALPTFYVVGDSTLKSGAPLRGWGDELAPFFDLTKINIVNRAIGGRSSRTYFTEGRWDKVLAEIKPGDFVIVQFGHNDGGDPKNPAGKGRPSLPGIGDDTDMAVKSDGITMESIHSFGWYMKKYGTDAKAKGATAVFASMVPHKDWAGGKIRRGQTNTFVPWTAAAAQSSGADYINLNEIASRELDKLGTDKVEALFGDARTHSTPAGAHLNAQCVVAGLRALPGAPFDKYLSDKGRAVTPAPADLVTGATVQAAK